MKAKLYIILVTLISISYCASGQRPGKSEKDQQAKDKRQQGIEYFKNRDYEKAADIFEDLFKDKPSQTNYIYLYNCLIGMSDYKQAERIVKKQIRSNPADPRYQVDLGYIYMSSEEKNKGRKQYNKVINEMPANRGVIKNTASAFRSRNENAFALKTYQKGRILLQQPWSFSLEVGQIYGMAGDYDKMYTSFLTELEHNDRFINSIKRYVENSFKEDEEGIKKQIFKKKLLKKLQKHSDNRSFSNLMIWYSIQEKDFKLALDQSKAIDKRYKEDGSSIYNLAQICISNERYEEAVEALEYLVKKGEGSLLYFPARNQLLVTNYLKLSNKETTIEEWQELEADFADALTEIGYNARSYELIRYLGQLQAFKMQDYPKAIRTLERGIETRGIRMPQLAQLKIELGDIYLYSGDPWEAILLYAQVHKTLKNDPIGHEAKFRHAKVSFYIGEFEWAKAQLDILKAATSKFIANDALELSLTLQNNLGIDSTNTALKIYARADMAMFMNRYDKALQILDTLENLQSYHELKDDAVYLKAQNFIALGDFVTADSLLRVVYDNYSFDMLSDNALFDRAKLQEEQMNNKTKAIELYSELMITHPGSIFAEEARKRYRKLKSEPELESDF